MIMCFIILSLCIRSTYRHQRATMQNNIFMRDHEHATPDTENRAIYIGGFSTVGRYEYMENITDYG